MTTGNDHSPKGEVNYNKNKRYEYLKNLDTSRLQSLLQQESFLDDKDFDVELIQNTISILDEREPVSEVPDVDAALKTFKEEIVPELEREKAVCNTTSRDCVTTPVRRRTFRRKFAAILVAAMVVMILGSTLVANAMGFNLWEYVINWGKETFQIGSGAQVTAEPATISPSQNEANSIKPGEFQSLDDAIADLNAAIVVPVWLPDGFEFLSASISDNSQLKTLTTVYEAEDKVVIFSAAVYSTEDAAYSYEINEASGESQLIDGNTCYIMTNVNQTRIVWIKSNVVYSINGDITKDDLIKMVHSIYEGVK